jgi:hypothetical protein
LHLKPNSPVPEKTGNSDDLLPDMLTLGDSLLRFPSLCYLWMSVFVLYQHFSLCRDFLLCHYFPVSAFLVGSWCEHFAGIRIALILPPPFFFFYGVYVYAFGQLDLVIHSAVFSILIPISTLSVFASPPSFFDFDIRGRRSVMSLICKFTLPRTQQIIRRVRSKIPR